MAAAGTAGGLPPDEVRQVYRRLLGGVHREGQPAEAESTPSSASPRPMPPCEWALFDRPNLCDPPKCPAITVSDVYDSTKEVKPRSTAFLEAKRPGAEILEMLRWIKRQRDRYKEESDELWIPVPVREGLPAASNSPGIAITLTSPTRGTFYLAEDR